MSALVASSHQHPLGAAPLEIVCFASVEVDLEDRELKAAIGTADLILALGNVDLDRIALAIGPDKPALCVLGPDDTQLTPPAPFRSLHGNGLVFNGWRIAGLAGAPLGARPGTGVSLTEADANALVSRMPACDILISHAPPAGQATPDGFRCLTEYVRTQTPIFHFYAAGAGHQAFDFGRVLIIGVHGVLAPPALVFA